LPAVVGAAAGPLRVGADQVELLSDGARAAERLREAIDQARERVRAEIYEIDRADIVAAVLRALAHGVTVQVISDPTVPGNARSLDAIGRAGAEVRFFPDGARQIDHVKLLVVDGRAAFFGGMNWGAHSYLNHDFEVALSGPSVEQLSALFEADLSRTGALLAGPDVVRVPPGARPLEIISTWPDDQIGPAVMRALAGARRFVFIEMYVLTDHQALEDLVAAARRGVAVFVLLDPGQDLNQAALVRIRAGGGAARFYRSSGEKLHAKAMVVDGAEIIVGSANWTRSGFTRNHELDADIRDAAIANAALARMELDWRASGELSER
jgi:cardiolipin synthase